MNHLNKKKHSFCILIFTLLIFSNEAKTETNLNNKSVTEEIKNIFDTGFLLPDKPYQSQQHPQSQHQQAGSQSHYNYTPNQPNSQQEQHQYATAYYPVSTNHEPTPAISQEQSIAEWSVLVYMQADNSLARMAIYNAEQMKQVENSSKINLLLQWDKPETSKTHRIKIEKNREIDVGSLNQEMGQDPAGEILDAMKWLKQKYPAKKYFLVLWNHGGGIDERVRTKHNLIAPEGFTRKLTPEEQRGILYDDSQGTYLTNEAMGEVMRKIKVELGQKVDLIGMDACLMSMVEVGYVLRNSTDLMVGSENIEQGFGWNYKNFLNKLVENPSMSAKELANNIVQAYQKFYLKTDKSFTQSCVDINQINQLKDTINKFVIACLEIKAIQPQIIEKILHYAHQDTIKFQDHYLDLYNFCDNMIKYTNSYILHFIKYAETQPSHKECKASLKNLEDTLIEMKKLIRQAVNCSVSGSSISEAGGISIYFPNIWQTKPNPKYENSSFAKDTIWSKLLHMFN